LARLHLTSLYCPFLAPSTLSLMVPGIRFVGSDVTDCEVVLDGTFIPCPTAQALGIPLVVKREAGAGVGCTMHLCVRFMTDPRIGLAPIDWQYGGAVGPAPPVVAARTDGIPFTTMGWEKLDDFIDSMFEEGPRNVNRRCLVRFLREERDLPDLSRSLNLRFPMHMRVKPAGLQTAAVLNGIVGIVTGRRDNGRVGVKFPDPHGVKALRPGALLLENGDPADQGDGDAEECKQSDEDDEEMP